MPNRGRARPDTRLRLPVQVDGRVEGFLAVVQDTLARCEFRIRTGDHRARIRRVAAIHNSDRRARRHPLCQAILRLAGRGELSLDDVTLRLE